MLFTYRLYTIATSSCHLWGKEIYKFIRILYPTEDVAQILL